MSGSELGAEIADMTRMRLLDIATDEIGTGLSVVVFHGRRRLHLDDRDLVSYVHGVIAGMVAGGASPEDDSFVTPSNPQGLAHFGADTPQEVADGITAAWIAGGMPDLEWGDWRFNTAENRAYLDEIAAGTPATSAS